MARGVPAVAGARFAVAMAQSDSEAALGAWSDYYWLTDDDAPQALARYAGRVRQLFSSAFAPSASDGDILALLELLTRAGFTLEARQFAAETQVGARAADNPVWRKIDSFFTFDTRVRTSALRANREMASGGDAAWYEGEIRAAMGQLMQATGVSGDPREALPEHFGIFGSLGTTGGYMSLHGGHLVQQETIAVSQYGRSGEMRFVVIDRMLSNGFETWLWDGWAETGGWSADGTLIVQVRSSYTDGPLATLRNARPGPDRDRYIENLEQATIAERAALGRNGVAQLPATSNRLSMQAWDQIIARVGADDDAFLAESWRATNQTSIEAHEGRHALDNAHQPGLSSAQLEFRAKLSQIIFADYPRLGLASVAGGIINDTPHGIGNRRVLEGYRRWMRRYRRQIEGFDPSLPTLSQLHLLSDAQIVAAARSLDPWAED